LIAGAEIENLARLDARVCAQPLDIAAMGSID
jgi:hypothetical protein